MSANEQIFLQKLITLLAENKKFPKYSAERRIDIFINFFLEDILKSQSKFKDVDFIKKEGGGLFIIPEFPLKNKESHRSTNVDYVCFSKNNKCYFIELKTDSSSVKDKQLQTYIQARENGFEKKLTEILCIYKATNQKTKYDYLLRELASNIDSIEITEIEESKRRKNQKYFIKGIKIDIEIIYIGPADVFDKNNKEILKEGNIEIIELDDDKIKINQEYAEIWGFIKKKLFEIVN